MASKVNEPLVVLTHALPRVDKLVSELKQLGIDAVAIGLQKIVVSDTLRAETLAFKTKLPLFDTVVFVSPNAVEVFFDSPVAVSIPASIQWLCVGQATAQALRQHLPAANHKSIVCGISNDADSVLILLNALRKEKLVKTNSPNDKGVTSKALKVLVVRGSSGREDWIAACQQAGDAVEILPAYTSVEQLPSFAFTQQLRACQQSRDQAVVTPVCFVVASTQLARQLHQWLSATSPELVQWAMQQTTLAIHPKIVEQLESFGFVAPKLISPGVQGIVQGLK
jgi:uroporphyrinogen-III synthase